MPDLHDDDPRAHLRLQRAAQDEERPEEVGARRRGARDAARLIKRTAATGAAHKLRRRGWAGRVFGTPGRGERAQHTCDVIVICP